MDGLIKKSNRGSKVAESHRKREHLMVLNALAVSPKQTFSLTEERFIEIGRQRECQLIASAEREAELLHLPRLALRPGGPETSPIQPRASKCEREAN